MSTRLYSSALLPAHLPRACVMYCEHVDFIAADVPPMRFECKAHRFGFGALSSLLIIYRSGGSMYEYERGLFVGRRIEVSIDVSPSALDLRGCTCTTVPDMGL